LYKKAKKSNKEEGRKKAKVESSHFSFDNKNLH